MYWRMRINTRIARIFSFLSEGSLDILDMLNINEPLLHKWDVPEVEDMADYDEEGVRLPYNRESMRFTNFISRAGNIICDKKTKDILMPFEDGMSEFLPVLHSEENQHYYILHMTQAVDCLDHDKSEFQYFSTGRIQKILKIVFKDNCLPNANFLCLKESRAINIWVSDQVKQAIEDNGLTGVTFEPASWETD